MQIRKARYEDLDEIMEIYQAARAFMVKTGNPNQWAVRNWPPRWLIERDIEQGKSYVCQEDGILAVFFYDYGEKVEPCYEKIDNGSWIGEDTYGVVHRIAARAGTGAGKFCIDWAYRQNGHLRIDTHGDNKVMQKILLNMGFTQCGIIYVNEDQDPRIAYEKMGLS
jgi:RimJ/RimL family protein N-acetyltransferase